MDISTRSNRSNLNSTMDAQKRTELLNPYTELTTTNSKTYRLQFSTSNPFTPTYVTSNLSLSSDPVGMYASRVKGRQILLENPARESRAMKELEEKRVRKKRDKEKKKRGIIGKREAKEKSVWKFDQAQAKFDLFLPLHHLWMGYMSELLGLSCEPSIASTSAMAKAMPNSASMHPKLLKADFHGSIMTVRQSKNPCLLGLSGIVIHETENAFKVVTKHDKLKVIPKRNSIFAFAVPLYSTLPPTHTADMPLPLAPPFPAGSSTPAKTEAVASLRMTVLDNPHIELELYGNQFRFRSSDRAGRKFKHKETIEL